MRAIERAEAAVSALVHPGFGHAPEFPAVVARAAILAFLDGVEKSNLIWTVLDDTDDEGNTARAARILAALRAEADSDER